MGLPCVHFRPASMISHLELSIIKGTLAISGSTEIKFKKVVIAFTPSISAASILMSSTLAPLSTCCSATAKAAV